MKKTAETTLSTREHEFTASLVGGIRDATPKGIYEGIDERATRTLKLLHDRIEDVFTRMVKESDYQRLVRQNKEIQPAVEALKGTYLEIIRPYMDIHYLYDAHLTPMERILYLSEKPDEFLRKATLLRETLENTGQTVLLKEKSTPLPTYDERKRTEAERRIAVARLFDNEDQDRQKEREELSRKKQKIAQLMARAAERNPHEPVFNHISSLNKASDMQTLIKNPEAEEYVPFIWTSVADYLATSILPQTIDLVKDNIKAIFRNPQHSEYSGFKENVRQINAENSLKLQKILRTGKTFRGRKVREIGIHEATPYVQNWMARYYGLGEQTAKEIAELRKQHAKSLVEIINGTVTNMLKGEEEVVA